MFFQLGSKFYVLPSGISVNELISNLLVWRFRWLYLSNAEVINNPRGSAVVALQYSGLPCPY